MQNKNKLKLCSFIFFITLVCSTLTGCVNQKKAENVITRDSLIIGISDNIYGFFPWMESYDVLTLTVNKNIFDGLVNFDQIFRTKPELATSWNNPDNLTWRFFLRKDVKFHNGYDFTSEDVKYTIDFIKNDTTNVLRDLLISVKEVNIIDEHTVDIITETPCPVLLNKLVDIPIVSKKYQEETKNEWPIGTGPYKFVQYKNNEYIKLESFDDYWKKSLTIKNITFKIIKEEEDMKNATISGEIDIASHISARYVDEVENCPGITIDRMTYPTVYFLSFDFRENNSVGYPGEKNPLSDVRVRKAIYHAINVTEIIDNVLGGSEFAVPATQFVSPLIFGYDPNIIRLSYDINESKALLKEAGYENGFELVIDGSKDWVQDAEICELIQKQLSGLIDVKINLLPSEEYYTKICMRNTSFYLLGWLAATGDGGEIYDYMIRSVNSTAGIGTYNLGYYSNPEIDRIADEISMILNPEDRLQLMQEGFRIAINDVAWIPLYIPTCICAKADYVAWDPSPDMKIEVENIEFI